MVLMDSFTMNQSYHVPQDLTLSRFPGFTLNIERDETNHRLYFVDDVFSHRLDDCERSLLVFDCHLESENLSDIGCFLASTALPMNSPHLWTGGYLFQYGGWSNQRHTL